MTCKRMRATLAAVLLLVLVLALTACAPAKVAVPDLSGSSAAEAEGALTAAKLTKGSITEDYSADNPGGTVFQQNPPAGTEVDEGSAVDFVVSLGEPPAPQVAVPDVDGMDVDKATSTLEAAGLSILPYDEFSSDAKIGEAFGQLPAAGSQRDAGSPVFVAFSLGKHPTNEKVPGVTGKKKADAVAALKKDGFKVVVKTLHVVGVKKGEVVAQVPAKNDKAAPGSTVVIMVSSGSPAAKIPDVSKMSQHKASVALQDAGFAPAVFHSASASVPKGQVMGQLPISGKEEIHGTEVAIIISAGDVAGGAPGAAGTATATLAPDAVGQTKTAAKSTIEAAGLMPQFVDAHDPQVKAGEIIRQVPEAGEPVRAGQDVVLSISVGPTSKFEVKAPKVVGKSAADAEAALSGASLRTHITRLHSTMVAKGKVMGQLPESGDKVLKNAKVTIVVSLGKPPALDTTVPDVVGKSEADAVAELEKVGLTVITASQFGAESQPSGTVSDQFPLGSTKVKAGSTVVIVAAR